MLPICAGMLRICSVRATELLLLELALELLPALELEEVLPVLLLELLLAGVAALASLPPPPPPPQAQTNSDRRTPKRTFFMLGIFLRYQRPH